MNLRTLLLLICLLFSAQIITAGTIVITDPNAPFPFPFPHDGRIDWSVFPGIGNFSAPHMEGQVSDIPNLSWVFDASNAGFFVRGQCIGSIPDTSCSPGQTPLVNDTWVGWGAGGLVTISFSRPIAGLGMITANPNPFSMQAFDSQGNLVDQLSLPQFALPSFVGIESQSVNISSITFTAGEKVWTGDVQIQSDVVPEPTTLALVAIGIALIVRTSRKREHRRCCG
jgi:hypothetical protein